MVDTDIGALDKGKEALDGIRVDTVFGLVGRVMVDPSQFSKADIVVRAMLVGEDDRAGCDVIPSGLRVLVEDYARERAVRRALELLSRGVTNLCFICCF